MADLSLQDSVAFFDFRRSLTAVSKPSKQGSGHLDATHAWLDGIKNRILLNRWRDFYREMADRFVVADPKKRVPWVGPDMNSDPA